jgi:hypothetical protein
MMWISSLLVVLLLQAPVSAPLQQPVEKVVVGLLDGQQIVVESPEFSGFISGLGADAVLTYRQQNLHGQMPARSISKIEFGPYEKSRPFAITVTLRNGRTLQVEPERHEFITVQGRTDVGSVRINHPDPISPPLRLSTKRPDRKNDLTIQYLEFPPS